MNRTYIELYYERYKDADFVADCIKQEMKLGYEWLKSRSDRDEIVEEIVKCRVKFVKYLKIINLNDRNMPKIRAWQWIMIEYQAIMNYILTGKCGFRCFEEENKPKLPLFEDFKYENWYKETYLSSVQTRYQWLASSYLEPNAIVTHVN